MQQNIKMDDELMHYGVLGMRWGVHRSKNSSSVSPRRRRKQANISEDAKIAKALKEKKLDEMSNTELRKLNERQNLERNYRQANRGHIATGMKFVSSAAVTTGTILTLYNNNKKIINIGKKFAEKHNKFINIGKKFAEKHNK